MNNEYRSGGKTGGQCKKSDDQSKPTFIIRYSVFNIRYSKEMMNAE
jgi:hypothetical protein